MYLLLGESGLFKTIRKGKTNFLKENQFPIAWIYLSGESYSSGSLKQQMRHITLRIRVAVKQNYEEDLINDLIDSTIELIRNNYTLKDTVLQATLTGITTDDGLLFPYSMADLTWDLLVF